MYVDLKVSTWSICTEERMLTFMCLHDFFWFFFCVGDVYLTSGFILSQSPFINMKHWHILKTYKYSLHYRQEVWILKVEKRVSWLVLYMIWNFDIFAELIHKKQNDSELLNQNILNMWLITLFRRTACDTCLTKKMISTIAITTEAYTFFNSSYTTDF